MRHIPIKRITPPTITAEHLRERSGVARTHRLLRDAGRSPWVTPPVLAAALKVCAPVESREWLLLEAEQALRSQLALVPRGLEELPLPWLKALPGIWRDLCRRNPRWLGTALGAVGADQGVFRLASVQEPILPLNALTQFDQLRVAINLRLYPSVWRPLKPEHERQIWQQHPALRRELFSVPVVGASLIAPPMNGLSAG